MTKIINWKKRYLFEAGYQSDIIFMQLLFCLDRFTTALYFFKFYLLQNEVISSSFAASVVKSSLVISLLMWAIKYWYCKFN